MNVKELFPKKPRQVNPAVGFTDDQIQANMELLKQELAGLKQGATLFFTGFSVPPTKNRPAQWRAWLLPGEDIADLTPTQVDYVLKNLDWFKGEIAKKQALLDDDLIL